MTRSCEFTPKLEFRGIFTWDVDKKGSQVGVCVNRSNPSPTHLSLLCICCTWECASGKSPLFFIAASHTILFPSALARDWGKPSVCVYVCVSECVCVCVYTPLHLVTSEATTRIPHCQENPRLAGMPNAYARICDAHDSAHLHMFIGTRGLHILKCHMALSS